MPRQLKPRIWAHFERYDIRVNDAFRTTSAVPLYCLTGDDMEREIATGKTATECRNIARSMGYVVEFV